MLSKKMEDAINQQINAELYSAYIYAAMQADLEDKNLKGAATWMQMQIQEELSHAAKFVNYINERQGRVILEAIDKPPHEWDSVLEIFKGAYKHECYISGRINDLVSLARDENDHATYNFLQWYVSEQVEEEASVDEVVQKLKLIGDNGYGIFMLDQELGSRTFSPPADSPA